MECTMLSERNGSGKSWMWSSLSCTEVRASRHCFDVALERCKHTPGERRVSFSRTRGFQAQREGAAELWSCAVGWGLSLGRMVWGWAVPSLWGSSTHLDLGSLPPASLPAGCGRCAASAPSAKEVWENGGLFPCSISRQEGEKKKGICACFSVRVCSLQK